MSTIKQIALKAGVSPTTVSNVLHGRKGRVSQEKRKRVQAVIESEKYAPNMGAHILAHNRSRIIGVIVFMPARSGETALEDPFTATILGAIEREIRLAGYFMMVYATQNSDEVLKLSAAWKLDGLLILWVTADMSGFIRKHTDTPVVFVDCYFHEDGQVYHNVGLEDKQGTYEITKYVIASGHKNLVFLADEKNPMGGDKFRLDGFIQALRDSKLPCSGANFLPLSKNAEARTFVYQKLCQPEVPFTALIFSSDFYAAEAINYFQKHNIKVPERFSVTGFDNNRFSQLIQPPLTTVHQDVTEKGRRAVSMLLKLIKKEPVNECSVRLPVRLVIRDSVCKLS